MKQVAFFVVGLAGLIILISFLGWELASLQRENARLREEVKTENHEFITKEGGIKQEDWKKIEELTAMDPSDATIKPQGLKAEESEKITGKEEIQTQSGAETPQQKLKRLGFSPNKFHRVDATATTR